jgi:hypothetical protein
MEQDSGFKLLILHIFWLITAARASMLVFIGNNKKMLVDKVKAF